MTKNDTTLNEQQLIKQNEILSKVILEIVYRDKENMSDEQIGTLFQREDWKEKTEFELKEHTDGWWMGFKGTHSYLVRPRKPLAILKRLYLDKKMWEEISDDYFKGTIDKKIKIDKLNKELKEKEVLVKDLETELEEEKLKASTHLDGIKVCEDWYFTHHINPLNKEVADKSELLQEADKGIVQEKAKSERLQQQLEEKSEMLKESDKEKEELKRQLHLANKSLPSLPTFILPKKQSKFQKLGTKIKTKFQNLAKKIKHQEKEFVAQIEVKVN